MEGMVVFDYADATRGHRRDGRLPEGRPHEEPRGRGARRRGRFPATLLKLFNGENFGKLVLQVADPQP
jgi:hypothetical protein